MKAISNIKLLTIIIAMLPLLNSCKIPEEVKKSSEQFNKTQIKFDSVNTATYETLLAFIEKCKEQDVAVLTSRFNERVTNEKELYDNKWEVVWDDYAAGKITEREKDRQLERIRDARNEKIRQYEKKLQDNIDKVENSFAGTKAHVDNVLKMQEEITEATTALNKYIQVKQADEIIVDEAKQLLPNLPEDIIGEAENWLKDIGISKLFNNN